MKRWFWLTTSWRGSYTASTRLSEVAADMDVLVNLRADAVIWDLESHSPMVVQCKWAGDACAPTSDEASPLAWITHVAELTALHDLGKASSVWSSSSVQAVQSADAPAEDEPDELTPLVWARTPCLLRACCTHSLADLHIGAFFLTACEAQGIEMGPNAFHGFQGLSRQSLLVTLHRDLFAENFRSVVRLIDSILATLRLMLVRLLTALAQFPNAAAFVLAMLAVCRHYGHRAEPDGHNPLLVRRHLTCLGSHPRT